MMKYLFRNGKFIMSINDSYKAKDSEIIIVASKYDYEKMMFSYIDKNGNIIYDEDAYNKHRQDNLKITLAKRYDKVLKIIPRLIDPDIFDGLEEVYKTKYNVAKETLETKNYSNFENEAKIYGIPPETIVKKIIQIGNLYKQAYDTKVLELDATRIYVKKLIEHKCYDEALSGLRFIKNLTPASTFEELINLCTNGLSVIEYCKNKL